MDSPDYGLVAIDLAAPGGPRTLWRERKTLPYIATPILYRGVLFLVKDGGILTSYEPKTGAVLKRGRIEGATEPFSPSPVAAGGRLYLTSSTGTVAVVSAQAQWETLAVNDLDEPVYASPGDRRWAAVRADPIEALRVRGKVTSSATTENGVAPTRTTTDEIRSDDAQPSSPRRDSARRLPRASSSASPMRRGHSV